MRVLDMTGERGMKPLTIYHTPFSNAVDARLSLFCSESQTPPHTHTGVLKYTCAYVDLPQTYCDYDLLMRQRAVS